MVSKTEAICKMQEEKMWKNWVKVQKSEGMKRKIRNTG